MTVARRTRHQRPKPKPIPAGELQQRHAAAWAEFNASLDGFIEDWSGQIAGRVRRYEAGRDGRGMREPSEVTQNRRPQGKISLLLADVDGTLVTKAKVLTERAIKAVEALHDAGIRFAVTSGRPPRGMAMLIGPLHIDTMIAGFNGGATVNPDGSVIEEKTLAPDVARKAIAVIAGHGLDAWLYTAKDWFITRRDAPHVDREAWTVKFDPVVVDRFADEELDRATKVVGVSDDLDAVAEAEADMQAALGDTASAARSQPYYLDVTHPHANKGDVVLALSKQLDIPTGEIATIGDMPNDVLMFKRSGFSIAMGNASDAVKAQASAVTASYEDEGFAEAIATFLLPPKSR